LLHFQAETTINAPAVTVWRVLTDAAHYPDWDPYCERIEGDIALGNQLKAFSSLSPGQAFPVTVTVLDTQGLDTQGETQTMVWQSKLPLGLFSGTRTFTVLDKGEHCDFRIEETFEGLLLPLFKRRIPDMREPFAAFAAGLKARAEA
jgi:hypothetical protein